MKVNMILEVLDNLSISKEMQSEDYKPTAQSQKASRASQSIPSVSKVFKNVDEPDPEGNLYDIYGAEGDSNRSSEGNNSGSLNNSSAKVKINNINSSSQKKRRINHSTKMATTERLGSRKRRIDLTV